MLLPFKLLSGMQQGGSLQPINFRTADQLAIEYSIFEDHSYFA